MCPEEEFRRVDIAIGPHRGALEVPIGYGMASENGAPTHIFHTRSILMTGFRKFACFWLIWSPDPHLEMCSEEEFRHVNSVKYSIPM